MNSDRRDDIKNINELPGHSINRIGIKNNHMKSYWKTVLFSFFFISSILATAQEICNNGVDDDGDGLIDCYDGDCSPTDPDATGVNRTSCEGFFFGNTVLCADEIDVTTFAIRQQWGSEDGSANSHATPMVGDLDGNGIPEVVATNKQARSVFILNGATGATIASTTFGFDPENAPVLGDIDNDEFGEILVSQDQGDDMIMFNHDLSIKWSGKASRNDAIGLPGFADFDENGTVEIYYRNEVVDAATGNIIVAGTNSDWERNFTHGSLAVDIFPASACADCAGLELVSGNEIWSINEAAGTRTLVADMDDDIHDDIASNLNYYPKYYSSWDDQWSSVSAADYNLDGNIDLIITGALGKSNETYNGETTIFFWDVTNGNVITYHDPTNDFVRGPGRVNIGDVDGDGQLNANFVMNQKLYSLDENFNVHWIHPIKEGSSGFTGCSLFDFDGDGAVEVVYRSEESLLIVDGVGNGDNTTSERREIPCISRTQEEYPVIADVDGDGASEICITCYFNNNTPFNPYGNSEFSHVRVFESDGEAWMPARGVWNQHGYYNVNINDDLTIPEEVQDHSIVFSPAGTCEYAGGGTIPYANRPLNTFINQAPILNEDGCVEFASPDIDFIGIVSATDAACPEAEITVEFEITNTGDIGISGNLPVSYYAGDPTAEPSNSILLDTEVTFLTNFEVGETVTITQTIAGIGGDFELFVVINDAGGTPPLDVPLPTASIPECETGNNIQSTLVGFQTFDLTVEKINDNRKCDPAKPDNASARAYYFGPAPGANENIWVENFQDRSNGAKSDTDETAWTSDGGTQSPSFYGVASYNGSNMFRASGTGTSNDVGVVTWTSQEIDISNYTDVGVTVDIFENGDQESSGQWKDWVRVSYELRDGSSNVIESNELGNGYQDGDFTYAQAIVGNLSPDGSAASLVIIAEIHNTSSSEHHYIDNIIVDGTGPSVTAEYTEPDGFVFNWYNDDDYSSPVYVGSQYPQMAEGTYDVIGYYGATECYSDTVEITIDLVTPTIYAWAYEVSSETNCESPDGAVAGFVYTQTTNGTFPANPGSGNFPLDSLYQEDGYTFEWFRTTDATNTIIGTGDTLTNLQAVTGGFTVNVTQNLTGCQTTAIGTVNSSLIKPDADNIDVNVTNIQACDGSQPGIMSASIGGTTAGYTFYWYDGIGVRPTPDHTGATYSVNEPGNYTVVAEDNASGCISDNFKTVVMGDDSNAPILTAREDQPNSTCGLNPTGIAVAAVNGAEGNPGFDYTWFVGVNTIPENEIPSGSFPSASFGAGEWEMTGLREGTYTIIVEETSTGCSDTTSVYIADNFVEPEFVLNNQIDTDDAINLQGQGYVELPQLFGPGNPVTNELTISYWADFTSANYSNDHRTFSSGSTGENQVLLWSDNHDGLAFVVRTSSGGRGRINSAYSATGWTQVTGTWNGTTGEMKMYANGVLIGETNHVGSGVLKNAGPNMFLGRDNNPGYGKFQGTVEELRIFNVALDESTINQYLCTELVGNEPGLVAYYNFNNVAGPAVADGANVPDETGNGHDGTARTSTGSVSTLTADIECPVADAVANTSCGAPNGSVDLSSYITPGGANYTYRLFDGFSTDTELANNNTGLFEGLAGGFYTLTAEDNDTDCITPPVTVSIPDIPDHPNIFTTVTDDPNCGSTGNGSIAVTSSSNSEEPVNGYRYELFDGFNTDPLNFITDDVQPGTGTTFSGLEDGNYRIRVTNEDLTCNSFVDVVVGDDSETPVFAASRTVNDNTGCVDPNGFISVSIDGDPDVNNYIFTWYAGDDPSIDPIEAGPQVGLNSIGGTPPNGLAAGDYTVVAEHVDTGCETVELTLTVNDLPYNPTPVAQQVAPQTDCGTGNGELTAYIDGSADPTLSCINCTESDGFTFEWYLDADLLNDGNPAANGSVPTFPIAGEFSTIEGLVADEYTVIITHTETQCSATESITLAAAQINPIIAFDSKSPNTICNDASTPYTGSITVTSTFDGANFTNDPLADYDWYTGSGVNPLNEIAGQDGPTLSNVQEGFYTVVVRNTETGCSSTSIIEEVVEAHDEPTVSFINNTPNSVCDPVLGTGNYNGSVEVDTDPGVIGGSGDFDFQWFTGAGTTPGQEIGGATLATLSNVQHGMYSVEITDNITGCIISDDIQISDARTNPTLVLGDINVSDVSVCTGAVNFPNGSVTVTTVDGFTSADPEFADYSFQWFTGAGTGSPIGGETSNVLNNRGTGEYTVRAVNDLTGCLSPTRTVEIEESLIDINAAETIQHYTNCVSPNGSIQVTASMASGPAPSGFTFDWFFGSGTSEPLDASDLTDGSNFAITPTGTDQSTASGLEDGTYTVRITNDDTQCTEVFEYDVEENQIIPSLDEVIIAAGVTDNTVCDPAEADGLGNDYNGIIDVAGSVTPTIGGGTSYTFRLFDDTDTEIDAINSPTTTFVNVAPGDYTITAEITNPANGGVGCQSTAAAVTVGNNLTLPDFDLTGNPDVLCSSDNGSIDIDFSGGVPADGFEIEIFTNAGATISQELIGAAITTFPQSSTANLTTGTYHVRFINNTTGCSAIESVFVNEVEDTPTMDPLDVVKSDDTFCNADNGSIAITVDDSNTPNNIGNNPIFRLYQGNSSSGTLLDTQQPGPGTTSHTFSGLAQGTYTVTVERVESGCISNEVTRTVNEVLVTFSPSITEVNQQTSCDLNDPNGEMSADADGGGTVAGYNFQWFRGTSTNPAQEVTAQFATAVVFGTNNSQVRGLPAGTYTVRVTDLTSGCFYTEQATLQNMQVDPAFVGGIGVNDSDQCSPGNGSLTVTVDDAGSPDPNNGATGYTFELFEGTSLIGSPLQSVTRPNSGLPNDEDTFAFTGLSEGDYTIRVTDNSTSCLVVSGTETINYVGPNPTITPEDMDNDPLTLTCFDNDGTLDIDDAISNVPGTYTDDITITWFIGTDTSDVSNLISAQVPGATFANTTMLNNGGSTINVINGLVDNLPAVSYTGVIEFTNGCKFLINTSLSILEQPDVLTSVSTNNTRCDAPYDGEITIDIDPDDGISAVQYEYFVYEGDVAIAPNTDPDGPFTPPLDDPAYGAPVASGLFPDNGTAAGAANASSVTIPNLNSGNYTIGIRIDDADGCITNILSETINDPEEPSVVLNTKSDNTVCDVSGGLFYNGSITVDASHPSLADAADFTWYEDLDDNGTYVALLAGNGSGAGFNVANETENGVTTNTVTGLGAGKYRVIIENNASACEDTLDVEIFDDPLPLDFDDGVATQTDQLDCSGGTNEFGVFNFPTVVEDGIALGAASADGNFDITWEYDSDQDGTFEVTPFTPNNDQNDADDLAPGDYRITIESLTSGCTTEYDFTIEDVSEDPVITLVGSINDNTICDGGPTNPNGSITVQIENQSGVVQNPVNYSIQWYKGSVSGTTRVPQDLEVTATTPTTATTASLVGVDDGNYIVVITDIVPNSESCETESTFFVVEDDLSEIEIQQLEGVDYTIGHQTFCNPDENGIITITNVYVDGAPLDAATGNFQFTWYDDDLGTPISVGTIAGANDQIAQDLPAGTYYTEVLNEDDDCVSELVSFTIDDDRVIPNLQTEQLARDSVCTTTAGSGSVLASVILPGGATDAAGEYTFEWFEGAGNAGDANFSLNGGGGSVTATGFIIGGANGEQVDNLPAGVYEVVVSNNAGGSDGDACSATSQVTVNQFTPVISIATADITIMDNENCSPSPNGSAEVTRVRVTSVNGGTYFIRPTDPEWANLTWEWYDNPTGGAPIDNDELLSNVGLGDGTYYVTISNWSDNGCGMTNRKEVIVDDDISPITITLTEDAPDNFCAPVTAGNGQITASLDINGVAENGAHYTVEWFEGSGFGSAIGATVSGFSLSNNDLTLTDIPDGTYTIRVTKDNTGAGATAPSLECVASAEITLTSDEEEITLEHDVDYTRTPNTVCDDAVVGNFNGGITITDVTEGGAKVGGTAGYSFTWTSEGGAALPAGATGGNTPVLGQVPAGIYEVTIENDARDCFSEIIQIEVEDDFTYPTLALNVTSTNTHCDGAPTLTGAIEATAAGGSGTYTFAWHDGQNPSGGTTTAIIGGVNPVSTASNLDGGFFTVVATDVNTGCTVTETAFVDESLDIPTLDIATIRAAVLPDTLCDTHPDVHSGRITINDGDINDSGTGDLTDYNISITDGGGADVAGSPFNATALTTIEVTNLPADTYSIDALNNTTGCSVATGTVVIQNQERQPLVTLESITPNRNCVGGTLAVGGLTVLVDGVYDHNNQGFLTFLWEDVASGNDVNAEFGVTEDEAVLSGVPAGDYRVIVTNNNTSCSSTRVYTVPDIPVSPIITSSEVNNNTVCAPPAVANGSFVLVEASYDGQLYDNDGASNPIDGVFELEVFTRAGDVQQGGTITNVPYEVTGLVPDDYYAVIRHVGSQCTSAEVDFEIEDNPFFPEITLTIDAADSTCAADPGVIVPGGTLTALADGEDHTNGDYSFQWYEGPTSTIGPGTQLDGSPLANGSVPVGFDESTVSGLATGVYSVEVMQTSTGCTSVAQINVPNVPVEVEIISVDVTDVTSCSPFDGIIDVTGVERSNQPDNLADYSFDFYDENPNNVGATPVFNVPTDGAVFNAASAGTYYIIGTNTVVNCTTPIFQVEVDEDITLPELTNVVSMPQTNCDPGNPDGSMSIFIDDPLTPATDELAPAMPDYTVTWYIGTDTTAANQLQNGVDPGNGSIPAGVSTSIVSGLTGDEFYTFMVIDNATGCALIDTEFLPFQERNFDVTLDIDPVTICSFDNGSITARVGGGFSDYDFYWYNGFVSSPDSTAYDYPLSNGNRLDSIGLGNGNGGNYTVLVVEKGDRYCSVVEFATINERLPEIEYELETSPVTVCFDDKNGFARVTLPDDAGSISHVWYDPDGDSLTNSNAISGLEAGQYRLLLTNSENGCFEEVFFDIFDESVLPNAPTVIVNNGRNNCSFSNGSAIANVDGLTSNFLFEWFDPSNMNTPYATGAEVFNLDSITYLVRATNLATGCESPMTSVEVGYEVVDPEFVVSFNNSVCLRTEDGSTNQFTGTAIIQFDEFNLATNYEWRDSNGTLVGTDSRLIDAYPGDYTVTFTAENGCSYEASFTIETSLTIYNGVSANADGKNDFFLIDCIDYFPNNNVKIYNRAGQRLYEVDGYNNTDVRFEGFSNVGGGGLQLPTGTYFYVIDLGNGEDPVQGFLELVR